LSIHPTDEATAQGCVIHISPEEFSSYPKVANGNKNRKKLDSTEKVKFKVNAVGS